MPSLSPADEGLLGVVNFPAQGSLRMPGPTYDTAKLVQELLQASTPITRASWCTTKLADAALFACTD